MRALFVTLVVLRLTSAAPHRPSQESEPVVTGRVLSVQPLRIEVLKDSARVVDAHSRLGNSQYRSHPVIAADSNSSPQLADLLHYGDIITAHVEFGLTGADELGSRLILQDVHHATTSLATVYRDRGFLIHYRPIKNSPQAYLTIYRDGTVLCRDRHELRSHRLQDSEMMRLRKAISRQLADVSADRFADEHGPTLILAADSFKQFRVSNPLPSVRSFIGTLDAIMDRYVQQATYHVSYFRRFDISDWAYGSIVQLDAIGDDSETSYRERNRARLAQLRPPASLSRRATMACRVNCAAYRYRSRIYAFNFADCTDGTTGTWACWQASEIPYNAVNPTTQFGYIDWPKSIGVRLSGIEPDGVDVPTSDYTAHREFYASLLDASRLFYKDDEHLFQGVVVRYH